MATGRDDFVIAIRSAFLKKKDKQKFSLLTLIFLSVFVIILSNFNFKAIQFIKIGINLPTDELLKVVILKIFSELIIFRISHQIDVL